jgi:hypothetical protein
MANLTDTQLLAAIAKANNSLMGSAEFRDYEHSTLTKLLGAESNVFRNLNQLKQSLEQPTSVDLFKRIYTASVTAKAAAHAAAGFPDSFTKAVTYLQRSQTFKVSYKQADNNRFGYDEILQSEMKNKIMSMYLDLSAYTTGWLDTNRSQVGVDSILLFDETTNDQVDIALADKAYAFEYMKSFMRKNKFNGMLDIIADQKMAAYYRQLSYNGTSNADNTAAQLPGIDLVEEAQLTSSAGGTGYMFQKGLVGMTTWNEQANTRGEGSIGNNEGLFTTMRDPILPFSHDVHVKRGVVDTSGSNGNVQDIVDEYEITCTYTVQGAWESTSNATPIFKVVQANA